MSDGIPANVNPFSLIVDFCLFEGTFKRIAPQYFTRDDDDVEFAPEELESLPIPQAEAEDLVRRLHEDDTGGCLAVKREFIHIIPVDLRSEISVTTSVLGLCYDHECSDADEFIDDSLAESSK